MSARRIYRTKNNIVFRTLAQILWLVNRLVNIIKNLLRRKREYPSFCKMSMNPLSLYSAVIRGDVPDLVTDSVFPNTDGEMKHRGNLLLFLIHWHGQHGLPKDEIHSKKMTTKGGHQSLKHWPESTFGLVASCAYIFVYGFGSYPKNQTDGMKYTSDTSMIAFVDFFFKHINSSWGAHIKIMRPQPGKEPNMYHWYHNQKKKALKGCFSDSKNHLNVFYAPTPSKAKGFYVGLAISIGIVLPDILQRIIDSQTMNISPDEELILKSMLQKSGKSEVGAACRIFSGLMDGPYDVPNDPTPNDE